MKYATAYAHLGDKQKALNWLDKAVDEPNRFALDFNVNPLFDSVRDNPRFTNLVQRVRISIAEIHPPAGYPKLERNSTEELVPASSNRLNPVR